MGDDPAWPALMTAYEAAIEEFERASKALTTALLRPGGPNGDRSALLAAEARARDGVVLTRMRLMNAWRDPDAPFGRLPGRAQPQKPTEQ